MIINRKSDRIVVEFGEGDDIVTAFFVPLTVASKASLSARVAPFVKFAGKNKADLMKAFVKEDGSIVDLDTPEKKAQFEELISAKTDIEVFTREVVRETLREIKGIKDNDGNEYVIELDQQGKPTNDCLDEIMSCEELMSRCVKIGSLLLHGVPREGQILDPETGAPIPGIVVKKSLKAAMKL
jgi:hypothetical protein